MSNYLSRNPDPEEQKVALINKRPSTASDQQPAARSAIALQASLHATRVLPRSSQ